MEKLAKSPVILPKDSTLPDKYEDPSMLENDVLKEEIKSSFDGMKRSTAFVQKAHRRLGSLLMEAKHRFQVDIREFCKRIEVSVSTGYRSVRFFELCDKYPGALAVENAAQACRTAEALELLMEAIDNLSDNDAEEAKAKNRWMREPRWKN